MKKRMTQEQVDELVRQFKGQNAVEKLEFDFDTFQTYRLSDGSLLRVDRYTGEVRIKTVGGRVRIAKEGR